MPQFRLLFGRAASRALAAAVTMLTVALAAPGARAQEAPDNRDAIIHVLNRITFGPRPGDVEMVQKMGLNNYIEQQLHPETIDDSAVEQEVSKFELLQMTSQQLTTLYVDDVKKVLKKAKKDAELKLAANPPAGTQPAANQPPATLVAS